MSILKKTGLPDFKIFSGSSHPPFAQAVVEELKKLYKKDILDSVCKKLDPYNDNVFLFDIVSEVVDRINDYIHERLNISLSPVELKKFSCGETYIRLDSSLRGYEVFLIQTGRTHHMNDDLTELRQMIDAAKRRGADKIWVVMPYFPYSRQDRMNDAGESISSKLEIKLLEASGMSGFLTCHLHSDQTTGFFDVQEDNFQSRSLFVDYLKEKIILDNRAVEIPVEDSLFLDYLGSKYISNPVIVAPDEGAAKKAGKLARILDLPLVFLYKRRPRHGESEIISVAGEVKGMTPIIIDDMIDTGGSIKHAAKVLRDMGSSDDIYILATHAVFSGDYEQNLTEANFREIVVTDSLPINTKLKNVVVLSLAPLFAKAIHHKLEHKSVSALAYK